MKANRPEYWIYLDWSELWGLTTNQPHNCSPAFNSGSVASMHIQRPWLAQKETDNGLGAVWVFEIMNWTDLRLIAYEKWHSV